MLDIWLATYAHVTMQVLSCQRAYIHMYLNWAELSQVKVVLVTRDLRNNSICLAIIITTNQLVYAGIGNKTPEL